MKVSRPRSLAILLALGWLVGCSKTDPAKHSDAASTGAAPTSDDAGASQAPTTQAPAQPSTFAGTYEIAVGTLYIPDDPAFKSVKFRNDEKAHLGSGKLTLTIDPTGRVSGASVDGPLGPATFEGTSEGTRISAQVSRKTATDDGLTGTMTGTREGDVLTGTMKISDATAAAVREASFRLTRQAP